LVVNKQLAVIVEIRRSRKRALFVRPRVGVLSVIGILRQQSFGDTANSSPFIDLHVSRP
jgi:hypothetical protein